MSSRCKPSTRASDSMLSTSFAAARQPRTHSPRSAPARRDGAVGHREYGSRPFAAVGDGAGTAAATPTVVVPGRDIAGGTAPMLALVPVAPAVDAAPTVPLAGGAA